MNKNWAVSIIIVNGLIFLIQLLLRNVFVPYDIAGNVVSIDIATYYLGLIPQLVVEKLYIWQIISYMFLHSTSSFAHILFNMYAVFIFGMPVERLWGSKKFIIYFLICGIGAGVAIFAIALITGGMGYYIPTIGASGAVFGLLLAFGVLFPNVEILLFFIIPIRARTLVILYGGLELFLELSGGADNISHIGHLGGLATGILYFIVTRKHAIRYKTKGFVAAQMKKEAIPNEPDMNYKREAELQRAIVKKLREHGVESLNDDEVQYIHYKEIMIDIEEEDVTCDLQIFLDDNCNGCGNRDACFIKIVKSFKKE
ncbi:MAG: rhomboid family intramembrane serine protease [Spirochaetes bacterium]|jgi:membrane associated rhomboid family serine protease|nr:rhomboid family intramembrane serine protease [Spirochaetota bacterium]